MSYFRTGIRTIIGAESFHSPVRDGKGWVEHLGRWAPDPAERGAPAQAPEWPRNALIPIAYHPVPDIA